MTVVRRLARPLLAAMYIDGGLDALRHPSSRVAKAEPVVHKLAGPLHLPDDPELLIRANGAAMVAAGGLLAVGKLPRLQRPGARRDAGARRRWPATGSGRSPTRPRSGPSGSTSSRTSACSAATLLAAVDTGGKPGMPWRARRAAKDVSRAAHTAKREAKLNAKAAKAQARLAAKQAERRTALRLAGTTASNARVSTPDWPAPLAAGPVDATVALPGSKSLTNRYLVLAALAGGPVPAAPAAALARHPADGRRTDRARGRAGRPRQPAAPRRQRRPRPVRGRLAGHPRRPARPGGHRLRAGRHGDAVPAAGGRARRRPDRLRRRRAGPGPPDGSGAGRPARPGRPDRRRRLAAVRRPRHRRAARRRGHDRRLDVQPVRLRPAAGRRPVRRGRDRAPRRASRCRASRTSR